MAGKLGAVPSDRTTQEPRVLTLGVPGASSVRLRRRRRGFEQRQVAVPDLTKRTAKASGIVELPLHLSWSGDHYSYDLSDRNDRARLYERVLTEGTSKDITDYVELGFLVDAWDDLVLPAHIREAWQPIIEEHRR